MKAGEAVAVSKVCQRRPSGSDRLTAQGGNSFWAVIMAWMTAGSLMDEVGAPPDAAPAAAVPAAETKPDKVARAAVATEKSLMVRSVLCNRAYE